MTTRDVELDFGYAPPTATQREAFTRSIVGPAGVYVANNVIDFGINGARMTQLTGDDTILNAGGVFYYRDEGGSGAGLKLCVDWVVGPAPGPVDVQLLTLNQPFVTQAISGIQNSNYSVVFDFGSTAALTTGSRQIQTLPSLGGPLQALAVPNGCYGQYLALQVITSEPMSAGEFIAWIGLDVDSEVLGYADGFSIK